MIKTEENSLQEASVRWQFSNLSENHMDGKMKTFPTPRLLAYLQMTESKARVDSPSCVNHMKEHEREQDAPTTCLRAKTGKQVSAQVHSHHSLLSIVPNEQKCLTRETYDNLCRKHFGCFKVTHSMLAPLSRSSLSERSRYVRDWLTWRVRNKSAHCWVAAEQNPSLWHKQK
jgi:hypothetical protein